MNALVATVLIAGLALAPAATAIGLDIFDAWRQRRAARRRARPLQRLT